MENLYDGLAIGIVLMIIGIPMIFRGWSKSKTVKVHASHGSVAVGGDNSGPIVNTNINQPSPAHHGHQWLTVTGTIVELVGIATTVWHAYHLAAK